MPAHFEPTKLRLRTSDNLTLEAEIVVPAAPKAAVLLAHPHPLHGGTMQSLVISELFRQLPMFGVATLRSNFRGVGASQGVHDNGIGEQLDLLAGLDTLARAVPDVTMVLTGWSFGADVGLAVTDERLHGWFAIAPPMRILPLEDLRASADPRPKMLAIPQHDEYNPPVRARRLTENWSATRLEVLAGADHFLAGSTDRLATMLHEFLESVSGRSR